MKALSQRYPLLFVLLLAASVLTSCCKDELVEPRDQVEGVTKSNSTPDGVDANEANGVGGDRDGKGEGISDDGDDLSGSERNKRKRSL